MLYTLIPKKKKNSWVGAFQLLQFSFTTDNFNLPNNFTIRYPYIEAKASHFHSALIELQEHAKRENEMGNKNETDQSIISIVISHFPMVDGLQNGYLF